MTRYTATLEWSTPDGGDWLDQVVHDLAEHSAHAAVGDRRSGLTLTVETEDIRAAATLAVDLATTAIGSAPPQLTGLSVSITSPRDEAPGLITWVMPDVMRVPDIAKAAGVSRQRVQQWVRQRDDFPPAIITTSYGGLYPRAAVERWLKQPRQAGRRAHRTTPSDKGDRA